VGSSDDFAISKLGLMRPLVLAAAACVVLSLAVSARADAAITGSNDGSALAGAMAGSPSPVSGASVITPNYPGGNGVLPNGFSDTPLAGFPTNGPSYTILTSGNSQLADDANSGTSSGSMNGVTGTGALAGANDYTILSVPITASQQARCVGFDFRFLSEEFPEYVGAGFNDTFLAELDQRTWAVSGQAISSLTDFAAGTGDRISVDASGPSAMSTANSAGTTYDGATSGLIARKYVTPGSHQVIFSIFDIGDQRLDSAVFIDNLRVTSEPPEQCRSLGLDPFEGTVGVESEKKVQLCASFDCAKFKITCNLPGGAPIPCQPFILAIVNFQTGQLGRVTDVATISKKKKVKLISKKQITIPAATTKTVKLKITKKGKKALKAAQRAGQKKLKVQLTAQNLANGVNKTFKVKMKIPKLKKQS